MSRCILPTLSLLLFIFPGVFAKNFQYEIFDTRNGLPSAEIYDVEVDDQGIVWVATDRGVASYDGYDFKVFTTEEGLYSNSSLRFFKDPEGRLWIPSLNGRLTVKDEEGFHPFSHNFLIDSINSEGLLLNLFAWDDHGNPIFSFIPFYDSGVYRIDVEASQAFRMSYDSLDEEFPVVVVGQNDWLDIGKGLYPAFRGNHFQTENSLYFWYFQAESILYHCHLDDPTRVDSVLMETQITDIKLSPKGDLLVSTFGGLLRFPNADLSQTPETYLEDLAISNIAYDLNGRLWLSTLQKGLLCIPNFSIAELQQKSGEKILGTIVSLNQLGSSLLVSSMEGDLYQVDSNQVVQKLTSTSHSFGSLSFGLVQNGEALFSNCRVYEKEGEVHFENRTVDNRDQVGFYTPKGFFALAGSNRIRLYGDHPWEKCREYPELSRRIICALPLEKEVFLGTLDGIFRMNENDEIETERLFPEEELFDCRINEILKGENGNLWVATLGKGLLGKVKGQTFQVSTDNGLGSNLVNRICMENDSTIWVAHNKGLDRVGLTANGDRLKIKKIHNLTNKDGLPTNFIRDVTFWRGRVCIGTGMGLWSFDPADVLPGKTLPPPIRLESVRVNQVPYPLGELAKLEHGQNDLSIRFTGITGKKPTRKAFYRYRLNGGDGVWHETNDRGVQFSNLAPGKYKFEVSARSQQGGWNRGPAAFSFIISPHYSQTLWFKGGAWGGAMLLFLGLSLIWVRQTRRKAGQQRALDRAELKAREAELAFLRNQMNPHFVFNALNSIQNYIFRKDVLKANHYLTCFSRLMRNTLEFSREESITLKEEIEFQRAYLEMEKMRFPDLFSVEWEIEPFLDQEAIRIPPLLCQPLLENAVKHAFHGIDYQGKILIRFSRTCDHFLTIVIRDNGTGLTEIETPMHARHHDSIGLGLVREQVERKVFGNLKGRFRMRNLYRPDGGSAGLEVQIELPLRREMQT